MTNIPSFIVDEADSFVGGTFETQIFYKDKNYPIYDANSMGHTIEVLFITLLIAMYSDRVKRGPPQKKPDFFVLCDGKWEPFEIKAFRGTTPGNDLPKFVDCAHEMAKPGGVKEILRSNYFVFQYSMTGSTVTIEGYKTGKLWQLPNYHTKLPLTIHIRAGAWAAIRCGRFNGIGDTSKTIYNFIDAMCRATEMCPNNLSTYDWPTELEKQQAKDDIIASIKQQFAELQLPGGPLEGICAPPPLVATFTSTIGGGVDEALRRVTDHFEINHDKARDIFLARGVFSK